MKVIDEMLGFFHKNVSFLTVLKVRELSKNE